MLGAFGAVLRHPRPRHTLGQRDRTARFFHHRRRSGLESQRAVLGAPGRLVESHRVGVSRPVSPAVSASWRSVSSTSCPGLAGTIWLYPLIFFVLMVAHSGVRLGRKTYVVDLASGNRRTDYVAVSNSVIGVVLLLLGSMGAVAQAFSVAAGDPGALRVRSRRRLHELEAAGGHPELPRRSPQVQITI